MDHIADIFDLETIRNPDIRNGCIFKTVSAVTAGTVEMDMDIVVVMVVLAVTQFVAGIFEYMDKVRVTKQHKRTENSALVYSPYHFFQLSH